MKILIYGAGVIGSIFGGKLSKLGQDVTMLARGERLEEIRNKGIVLIDPRSGKKEASKVKVKEELLPKDTFDYIFVVVQKTQVDAILPILAKNESRNIIFVVNTASGYDDWAHAIGGERLIAAFPSAGGVKVNGEVRYFIGKGLMRAFQTTTFGEYSGEKTERLKIIVKLFNDAGIPSVINQQMDMWQKSHVAMVTSIANALYKYDSNNYALSKSYEDIKLMICGIKEGFAVLNKLGIKTTPTKLIYFKLPMWIIAPFFRIIMDTKLAEITMAKHTTVAYEEMLCLQKEFDQIIQKSRLETPAINELRRNLFKL